MEFDNGRYLKLLADTPAWEWPDDAAARFVKILADPQAPAADRIAAADLAGDYTIINDQLAELLLGVIGSAGEPDELRATAAISLGPALETADQAIDWEDDDVPIGEAMFLRIQGTLHQIYSDQAVPKLVRRRVLEASVRAPQEWHPEAIRAAYAGGDRDWMLTAVFAMRYIPGFESQILQALKSGDLEIRYEAVVASGEMEVEAAWPTILKLLRAKDTPKGFLLAAIEAVGTIRPREAWDVLDPLTKSPDTDIAEAAQDAIDMAQAAIDFDAGDQEDDEEEK